MKSSETNDRPIFRTLIYLKNTSATANGWLHRFRCKDKPWITTFLGVFLPFLWHSRHCISIILPTYYPESGSRLLPFRRFEGYEKGWIILCEYEYKKRNYFLKVKQLYLIKVKHCWFSENVQLINFSLGFPVKESSGALICFIFLTFRRLGIFRAKMIIYVLYKLSTNL